MGALGKTDAKEADRLRTQLYAITQDLQNKYRVEVTGTAFSDKELEEIQRLIPSVERDSPLEFKNKVLAIKRLSEGKLDSYLGTLETAGRDVQAFRVKQSKRKSFNEQMEAAKAQTINKFLIGE
jgi:hypothetical protein